LVTTLDLIAQQRRGKKMIKKGEKVLGFYLDINILRKNACFGDCPFAPCISMQYG